MNIRKFPIITNNVYHVFNKSIERFRIFNNISDYSRMMALVKYYRFINIPVRYSYLVNRAIQEQLEIINYLEIKNEKLIEIIAYCMMPTHYHLIIKQLVDNGVPKFINQIQNSYAKYFNIKYDRKGPLWQGYFKNVLVDSDNQLLHLTRYIHLNPVTSGVINDPLDWDYSSLNEYLNKTKTRICNFDNLLTIKPNIYKKFLLNQINYQRELYRIKKLIIE